MCPLSFGNKGGAPDVEVVRVLSDNYCYLFTSSDGVMAAVDPGEAGPVIAHLEKTARRPDQIWLTHKHGDHVGGARELADRYGAKVYAPREAAAVVSGSVVLTDGDEFQLGREKVRIRQVSGHTRGHIVFLPAGKAFVGDVIFMGGCGRLFEGTAREMYEGISSVIDPLPDDTLYYCGHEYAEQNLRFAAALEPDNKEISAQVETVREMRSRDEPTVPARIGDEKRYNPFLRSSSESLLAALRRKKPDLSAAPAQVFAYTRKLRDGF